MSEPTPSGPEHVPDHVLEELLGAFSEEHTPPQYHFDDPSIDRLLGITDEHLAAADIDVVDDDDELEGDELEVVEIHPDEFELEPVAEPEPAAPVVTVPTAEQPASRKIIVIAEDDRPDSVYLDEDKEKRFNERRDAVDESGERSTIVIADLDEHGVSEAPVASSRGASIDPRIRARRISVRRAESRRRLVWVAIAAAIVLVAVAAIAIVASPIFDVRVVQVQGATYTDADVLQGVIDDLEGEPVLLVDTKAAEATLEAVPWVESARVQTDFPHTVVIDIRERRAVATFQGSDSKFRVIDAQGRVLDVIDNQPVDYPLIVGANPDSARGQFAGAVYASAAQLIVGLPEEIRGITQSVGVDAATGTLSLALDGEVDGTTVPVRLGDAKNLDEKLARLLLQIRSGLDKVCGLDVSTSDAGVVYC
ncbi:MAG: FtsQ-type POTRA domain-containing protein [Ilumatobacteraceae bacterium]